MRASLTALRRNAPSKAATDSNMIEVRGLTKRYRDHIAVQELSFDVRPGEILGFLGPNGAGKSTTMRIIAGYMPATSGTVKVGGIDVFEDPIAAKKKVGYLPEIPPVYLDMTVGAYLAFVARIKHVRGDLQGEVRRVAGLAGVDHILGRLIRNVSKGYRQRVGLAQALLGDPEVLILDEPTVGLDPIQIEQVRKTVLDLGKTGRHTIILSTHILSEVRAVCSRIVMIAHGRIVADAPIAGLEAEHGAPLEQVFTRLAVSG
jgi:ABC-2 type transport system ATP-binding protein